MNKLLLAVLAGIGIGILIAPDKGSETVRKLRGKFDDLTDRAGDEATDFVNRGKEVVNSGRDKVKDAFN